MKRSISLTLVFTLGLYCIATAQDLAIHPALNDDPPGAPEGARPYEMDWAGRAAPDHPQLADFENLEGWRVRCFEGADATLIRSKQEKLFGGYTARVEYSGTSARSRFVVEPPEPIAIPCDFTGVDLWVRGNTWSFMPNPDCAMVSITVLVRDAAGREYRVPLDPNSSDYWFLSHRTCVSPDGATVSYQPREPRMQFPAVFTGIEVSNVTNTKVEHLHFDALQFYVIAYPPLAFKPIPEDLPWPTTPDTILPRLQTPATVTVECGADRCVWNSASDEAIQFVYAPKTGTLDDIEAHARGRVFQPCAGGGIAFDFGGVETRCGGEGVTVALVSFAPVENGCMATWDIARGEAKARFSYTLRAKGKSLLVDVATEGGAATRLDIGAETGLADAKAVYIPYLTYGNDWPRVVCAPGDAGPVFLWAAPDYYHSDASELFGNSTVRVDGGLGYTGGAIYKPTTASARNPMRERIFINVSGEVHEVLPEIPNPTCDTGDIARECLWCNIGQAFQNDMLSGVKAYGIDKFIACHHEVGWRQAGESFTLRDRPAPNIGDAPLQEYSAFVRGLGYRFGTYTNYVDYAPVNANWNPDNVCLDPDGEWQRAWPRCYALKPLRAAEFEADYAARIHDRYGTTAQYCDVHTAYTPWGRTDYDARTPGAGMFKTQFNAFARLLWNESAAHHGPVFSEGNYHWFYAGIVDGDYATMLPYGEGWKQDPIVDFDLLKMHPKMTDFGMGFGQMYYGMTTDFWNKEPGRLNPWFERFTASTIAFGHIGFMTYEWGFDATLKGYYMVQALQKRYAMVPVKRIAYFDGNELLDTSAALIHDAQKRGQVHVEYESGLRLWVNLNLELDWTVELDGKRYALPPSGFLASKPDDILAYSASVDGGPRHELVDCAEYLYLDGRGEIVRTADIAATETAAVKPSGNGVWEIVPAAGDNPVTVSRAWLGASPRALFKATALNLAGETLGEAETRPGAAGVTVMPAPFEGVVKYRLETNGEQTDAWTIESAPAYVLPGETAYAKAHIARASGTPVASATISNIPESGAPKTVTLLLEGAHTGEWRMELPLQTPDETNAPSRAWFHARPDDNAPGCWLDVPVKAPLDVRFPSIGVLVSTEKPLELAAEMTSNQRKLIEAQVVLSVDHAPLDPKTVPLTPGVAVPLSWTLPKAPTPEARRLDLTTTWPGGETTMTRYLSTIVEEWIAADLTKTTYSSGQCQRGELEMPYDFTSTSAFVYGVRETLGGISLDGFHTHPPYKVKPGYVFMTWTVPIPEGHPRFEFAMGFRNGSTTTDGCVFKVVAILDGVETTVFEEQYQTLGQWAFRSASLEAFAGKTISLKAITDCGPNDDTNSDWALWGAPRIVMADPLQRIDLTEDAPPPAYALSPAPLAGLTRADLAKVTSAYVTLEVAGVDATDRYASFFYFNGVRVGQPPGGKGDLEWAPVSVPLTPEALATLVPVNLAVIKNPNGDCMKVRNPCLHFTLEDGREGASCIVLGPFTSDKTWPHAEGTSVVGGEDLPPMRLEVAVE